MEHRYLLFGDNLHESKEVMEKVERHFCDAWKPPLHVSLTGCPALPIYTIEYGGVSIMVECRGDYGNWHDLPKKVLEYISLFDKPDVVLYDLQRKKIVAAAEFTETVSVGNSQWQRSGRVVAAAILGIPFLAVYPCVAEDRSQDTLREPTALLTEFFFKLSLEDLHNPTLLFLRDDPYLSSLNSERAKSRLPLVERPWGDDLIGRWFGLRLILSVDESARPRLLETEREIHNWMFRSLYEPVQDNMNRVDNDLPHWSQFFGHPSRIEELRKHTLLDLSHVTWSAPSGKLAGNSYFSRVVVPELERVTNGGLRTYVEGGKHCVIQSEFTGRVEEVLRRLYPPHEEFPWRNGYLNVRLPSALISLQGWKGKRKLTPSDPNCGEAAAFPAMFDSLESREANVIFVIYGRLHSGWLEQYREGESGGKSNKLFRAIRRLGDLLCLDNAGNPTSIAVRRDAGN
jgi:hypothetical protein